MSLLQAIWQDLRSRKLLPVVGVLLVAIVAVPVVLSSSASSAAPVPPPAAPRVSSGLPAVSETTVSASAAPGGRSRNPFAPSSAANAVPTSSTTAATATPVASGVTGSTSSPGSSSTGSTPSPSTPSSSGGQTPTVPTTIPTPKPRHTTPELAADQSYSVSLAITNSSGGLNTIDPLERLSPLPSAISPLLVELGVLKGGSRVLFAVQPGTIVSGPGSCVPGPIDCEILSLAQAQTEKLSVHSTRGTVEVALFAVTAIGTVNHASPSAALRARNQESAAGRGVLRHSSLNALSLFHYDPAIGAVVDLRNLTLRDS